MSKYVALFVAITTSAWPATAADKKFDAEARAKAVAPYLDDQTVAVLHVDLSLVDADAVVTKATALANMEAEAVAAYRKNLTASLKSLADAGAHDVYIVFSLADVPQRPPFLVIPVSKDFKEEDFRTAGEPLWHFSRGGERIGDVFVASDEPATLKRVRALKPEARPEFAKAFAAADGDLAQLAIAPPKDAAKILESVMPTLPAEVGGGSSKALTRGFGWAAVGLSPSLDANLTIQAADADSAKALLDLLKKTYAAVGKSKEVHEAFPNYDKLTDLLTPKIVEDRLVLSLEAKPLAIALQPEVSKAVDFSARTRSINNMKQLVLAAHNYMDAYKTFPPAYSADKNGKPLLSWRVYLLPFLDQEKLYKEFHLDEPWDSEHNKKLIARMPAVFRSSTNPKLNAEFKTTYLAPIGEATMFPGAKGVRISDVADGTSNTIFLVDANDDHAVVWTQPKDLDYDAKEPMKGLGGRFQNIFLAAMADGSVRSISKSITKTTLQAAFTRNGGEVLGSDW